MNSYLDIAERVLGEVRRPLTPRQILAHAYARHLVPGHLFGTTQHKTIQARLSEDILSKRNDSAFFRPKPGQFFLRRYLQDETIPEEFRVPIAARRRTRDLLVSPALVVDKSSLEAELRGGDCINAATAYSQIKPGNWHYADPKRIDSATLLVWAAAVVIKGDHVLAYRAGRYRDDRDAFAQKQTIAFSTLVSESSRSLFDLDDFGVRESALRATILDLDIPVRPNQATPQEIKCHVKLFARGKDSSFDNAVLAVVVVQCPNWFEPTKRRLSLNELRWLNLKGLPNNIDDFDPWSQLLWQQISDRTVAAE